MDHASGCNGITPDAHGRGFGKLSRSGRRGALTSVELQADKYATGIPAGLSPPVNPLQFLCLSTGVETRFINLLDPAPKTRRISDVPHIHRPSTLADWLKADTLNEWVKRLHAEGGGLYTSANDTRPSSFRARIETLPPAATALRLRASGNVLQPGGDDPVLRVG